MNTLLVLYMIYLSWGTVGQGRVSYLDMSRYLRRSKSQTKNDMLLLAESGLVEIAELFSDAGAKKHFVQLSELGEDYLMQNFDAAILKYHQHVAETIAIINQRNQALGVQTRKLTKKEIETQALTKRLEGF